MVNDIDSNDILTQLFFEKKKFELQQRKGYYQKQIKIVEADRKALFSNSDLLERIARGKYYMSAEGEDVYVIISASGDQ